MDAIHPARRKKVSRADLGRLGGLAHFTARHRWPVIGVWIVLTVSVALRPGSSPRAGTRASPSPASRPTRRASGRSRPWASVFARRTSSSSTPAATRQRARRSKQAMRRAAATMPGARTSSYFSTGSLMYVSRDRHTTFEEVYPPGPSRIDVKSGAEQMRAAAANGLPAGITVNVTGHDPLEEASAARLRRRLERAAGGGDRWARRARDPAVRVRDAAGSADAARGRGRRNPQHVHPRLGPDLRHRRLDHRPVPDRARRPRRRDRLRPADDLPLPRRAPRRQRRRVSARRDDDPRRPLRDRLRLDGRGRSALDDRAAAAVASARWASAAC